MLLAEGQQLDQRYRLLNRIGSGGMADVWAAEDVELDRKVALKVLHENFARDHEFVERFRREASAAAGLQHPNVVGVFDRGTVDGTYYIAMELVEGSSLRELVDSGLDTGEAVEVARQVLSAASFAHDRGIVHRDLKPLNVLIDREGRIRVTDFGIARAGGSEITQTGSVMGTAQYLSPEQAQGMEVTAASDVYSIGVMLFEMLTGRVPFDGENAVAIAMKQVSEPPPRPSSINPQVPPALDAVVLRALAKEPQKRYASAAEMRAALDAAEADPQKGGHTARFAAFAATREDRGRRWLWAGLAALLVVALLLAWLLTRADQVRVPGVEGLTEARATTALERAGFEVEVVQAQAAQTEGTVFEQDPRGGTEADEGSTVTITVSLGLQPKEIPEVGGLSQKRAREKLRRAGFKRVSVQQEPSETVRRGRVIGTEPAEGTEVSVDERITMLVSGGSALVNVPNVVGQNRIDATTTLRNAGFVVNAEPEASEAPEDEVIGQSPPGDTDAKEGDEVTIVYSTGAEAIVLDDYVGQKQGFAERRLKKLGLSVSVRTEDVSDESDDGIVLDQFPSPGAELEEGDRVTIVVGEFVEPPPEEPAP